MKKLLALALCGAMVLSLAACGGSTTEETTAAATEAAETEAAGETEAEAGTSDVVLRMAWWGNQTRTENTLAALDLFTEETGVTFDTQAYNFSDYFANLATQGAGGELPDVFQMNDSSQLLTMVNEGQLLDLTPYVESGALNLDDCGEGIINAGKVGDGLYAICIGVNVPALIYNVDVVEEAGVEIKDNMTTEEFEEVARTIYEKTGIKTDIAYGNASSFLTYIMRGEGVVDIADETGMLVDDPDVFTPYFQIYEDGYTEGWMIDATIYADLTLNSVEQAPLVYYTSPSSQSWCACYWSNQITALTNAAPEGANNFKMTTWPSADPVASDFLHPSMYLSVAATSEHKDEAVAVVDFFTNSIEGNKLLAAERGVPISTAVSAGISDQLTDLNNMEIDFINNVVTPNSSDKSAIPPDGSSEFYSYADELCEQVLYGQLTAAEASEALYARGVELLGE